MAFTFTTALGNYTDRRYDVIRNLEEPGGIPHLEVYVDTKGYATIGAGFKVDSWTKAILENMALNGVGTIDTLGSNFNKAKNAITAATRGKTFASATAAQTAINDAMNTALGLTGANQLSFAFVNDTQVKGTFSAIAETFETTLNTWFGAANAIIPNDRERLALLSLAYNNLIGVKKDAAGQIISYKSPTLRQALINGDRAAAWYEIRYDSNGDKLDGIAKRRYYESSLFGLYVDPTAATKDEAYSAYRMFTAHRQTIIDYEKKYGQWQDASGDYYGQMRNNVYQAGLDYASVMSDLPGAVVPTIAIALREAKIKLDTELNTSYAGISLDASDFLSTAVQVAADKGSTLDGLVKNGTGVEVASDDLLVGGSGKDILLGQKGDDTFCRGSGR